jgi:hypothetical protein
MASTDSFRVWILAATSDQPLVRQSECHQARQIPSSTSAQKTHRATHALHQKAHS